MLRSAPVLEVTNAISLRQFGWLQFDMLQNPIEERIFDMRRRRVSHQRLVDNTLVAIQRQLRAQSLGRTKDSQ